MKRGWLALFALCFAAGAMAASLPVAVRQELKQAGIPQSSVAVVVQQVGKRQPLLHLNDERAMNPASTMKLLTTFAALDLLGPAYTWKTEAYLDGELKDGVLEGNLVLKGYGDPKFTVEQFWLWLAEMRARGLREIRGDLVLDRSYFDIPPFDAGAFDNDPVRAYNVGADALLLNFNTLKLSYLPEGGALRVFTEPRLDGLPLDNRLAALADGPCDDWDDGILVETGGDVVALRGGYPGVCGERSHNLSLMPHARYVEAVFRSLWRELGGTLQGVARDGAASERARLFATHRSEPLAQVIRDINKFSNNVMARQLFLTLGEAAPALPADGEGVSAAPMSVARSVQTVQDWLVQQGLDFPELVLENGAGLSRIERISADHLAQLLLRAAAHPLSAELQASLPILGVDGTMKKRLKDSPAASHAHLKSGTLDGVRTLAGYVRSDAGREWVVVCFIAHPSAKSGKAAQDALVEWVRGLE
ncbi:MAG: D-alanyl-D-alanine carboxypeptidase/D-alanyl-D-alanine-endopeptidase [Gallionella sp.]|nr:D-alanyl-D-alanine carboxypeptidase/D-alanyl-D-alanine-endopeptidase [Gallionella sp.]MDD4945511.1 D-alanyl-D-alanine carboxypeptidase/D-alanyl-D-alanine-endopeptidase [Gallionella sp.]MDD5613073.1 D-alanyl-D-alanine carboxypeptidase/D-alanyl-D-alanine-endopeptidase [Gallionella sp.]